MNTFDVFTLSNNIKVIHERVPGRNNLSVGVLVKVGSRYESKALNGISHFTEHIQFSGTTSRNKKQLNKDIDMVGHSNAFTDKDTTFYYIDTVKSKFDSAVELISDILCNPVFTEEDIKREQKIVGEEIGSTLDQPINYIFGKAFEDVFGNESLGMHVLGTHKTINTFKPETVRDFQDAFYTADNIVISTAGDLSKEIVQQALEVAFSGFRKARKVSVKPPITPVFSFKTKKYKKPINDAYVCLSMRGANVYSKDRYAFYAMNNILGNGSSSRLFQKIREEQGLCYYINSYTTLYTDCGVFSVVAATGKKTYKKLLDGVLKEIQLLRTTLTKQDVEDAKNKLKLNAEIRFDDIEEKVYANALQVARRKKPVFGLQAYMKNIDAVRYQSVITCIDKYLVDQPYGITLAGDI